MQKNLIISLVTGQLVALLPLWDWGDKLTFLTGSICITIVAMNRTQHCLHDSFNRPAGENKKSPHICKCKGLKQLT